MDLSIYKRLSINGIPLKELRANGKLIWSAMVKWAKYNCIVNTTTTYVYEEVTPSGKTESLSFYRMHVAANYYFDKDVGFYASAQTVYTTEAEVNQWLAEGRIVGEYIVYSGRVYEILSVDSVVTGATGKMTCTITGKVVAECESTATTTETTYAKGSVSYGTIEAEEGSLPEEGTLIEGSVADGYCVLEINGTYFYYILQND